LRASIGDLAGINIDTMNRRCGPVPVVVIAALLLSACQHYSPYRYPRPGEPSATQLENKLDERDSLQDAANDMIAVAAAMRDAVQRVYPATRWAPLADGLQADGVLANCAPPFLFLTGNVYVLPGWQSPAPAAGPDAEAAVGAVADVLKAHHADKVKATAGRSVSGELRREHGKLQFNITQPTNQKPPSMTVTGTTECHHAAPGPGPWGTSAKPAPAPAPGNAPVSPAPSPGNGPAQPAPPP
jgi:Lipoprotein confined to pathogenic Mycobacterium